MRDVPAIRELRFLQRLALAAGSTLDAATLVNLVIAETTEATETDVCSVYLLAADGEHLVLAATNGLSQRGVGRVRLRMGDGVTGWAAEARVPVVVPDVRVEPRFRWLPEVDQDRFVSMCSVPIISGDRLVGVLNVQTDHPRDFGEGEVGLLSAIAAHVAGALERTELQGRLESRVAELHRSEEIHKRFTDLALAGAGLDAICAAVAVHAGAAAAVFDDDGERLGASPGGGLPDRMAGVSTPARRDDGIAVVPIRAGQETLGWLAIGPGGGADSHGRRMAVDHGATVIALDLMRERAAAEAERRLRADLLDELLAARAGTTDASRLARKAARLGLRIRGRVWAVVIAPDDPEGARAVVTDPIAQRVSRALADAIDVPGGQVVARGTTFVLLVPGDADLARVEQIARRAADAAQARTGGYGFSAGIGSGAGGPGELRRLVSEAEQALALVQRGAVAVRCWPTRASGSIGFFWRSPTTSAWARMSRSGSGISSVTMSGDPQRLHSSRPLRRSSRRAGTCGPPRDGSASTPTRSTIASGEFRTSPGGISTTRRPVSRSRSRFAGISCSERCAAPQSTRWAPRTG